jgi:hypothetical protein
MHSERISTWPAAMTASWPVSDFDLITWQGRDVRLDENLVLATSGGTLSATRIARGLIQ